VRIPDFHLFALPFSKSDVVVHICSVVWKGFLLKYIEDLLIWKIIAVWVIWVTTDAQARCIWEVTYSVDPWSITMMKGAILGPMMGDLDNLCA